MLKKVKLNVTVFHIILTFVLALGAANSLHAQSKTTEGEDRELAEKLRTDLQFDTNRRNAFFQHQDENKIYDQEREKGLSLFLEEEERWNRLREKDSREQAKMRPKPMDEFGPEYQADLKLKEAFEKKREVDRRSHVRTKRNLILEFEDKIPQSEEKELGIANARPRYDLRKRARNKWVNSGKKLQGGSSGSSSSSPFDAPSMPSPNDFVAPPVDTNFEDIPPPPPPIPYDNFDQGNAGGFDSGFGDVPPPPPPPPPNDPSWDF